MTTTNFNARLHGLFGACLLIFAVLVTASAAAACTGQTPNPANTAPSTMAAMDGVHTAYYLIHSLLLGRVEFEALR